MTNFAAESVMKIAGKNFKILKLRLWVAGSTMVVDAQFVVVPVSSTLTSELDTRCYKLKQLNTKSLGIKYLKRGHQVLVTNKLWLTDLPKLTN